MGRSELVGKGQQLYNYNERHNVSETQDEQTPAEDAPQTNSPGGDAPAEDANAAESSEDAAPSDGE